VKTGSAVPASKGVIHVTAAGMSTVPPAPAKPAVAVPATKPTARADMETALGKKVKAGTSTETPVTPAITATQAPGTETASAEEPAPPSETVAAAEPIPGEKLGEAPKAKTNPWKLVDEHKAARLKAETEALELRKLVANEAARKAEIAEIEQIRTRNKELEDEIRYVNYEKSPEFEDKYHKPYLKAWNKAMAELGEINVEDIETGESRPMAPKDLLKLVNLSLGEARTLADKLYGNLANDVMAHRNKVKEVWDARAEALAEARTQGAEREKKMHDDFQSRVSAINSEVTETWQKANEAAIKDEKYGPMFVPIEGDQDGNQRLAKGFELVDRAFKENPMDPKLSPEERASIVKRHTAVRYRAAAFGRLVAQLNKEKEDHAATKTELAQFKGSAPTIAGGPPAKPDTGPTDARGQMEAALGKLAK
jgi:hypothetical protein